MSKQMRLFTYMATVIVAMFITLCILLHTHPTANPWPMYYFALPLMVAKLSMAYSFVK